MVCDSLLADISFSQSLNIKIFLRKSNLRTTTLPFAGCWFAKSWKHLFSQLSVAVFDIYRASGCISSKREASKFLCVTLLSPLAKNLDTISLHLIYILANLALSFCILPQSQLEIVLTFLHQNFLHLLFLF